MKKVLCSFLGMAMAAALVLPAFAFAAQEIKLPEVQKLVEQKPEDGNYMLIDARPEIKYFGGHLPWAVSLPWQELEDRVDELPADKQTKLVFYCGGLKCDLSHKSAEYAESFGYENVHVFAEGMPAWKKADTPWVTTNYIKMLINDRDRIGVIVDARPFLKFNEGTVPGALNIPWQEWDKLKGTLPADKSTELIFFCGGLKCDLSHKSAAAARELGYTNAKTYAYGWPDWKKNSTRAFAMINPKDGGATASAEPEEVLYEGEISQDEFMQLMQEKPEGFLLVDVRPEEDFQKGHLPGAINILDEKVGEHADKLKGKNVVFYCSTGSRCAAAFYAAEDAGVEGTHFLNKTVDIKPDGSYTIE